ncbi:MAG: GDYXXLXY domain-containing protein [Alphaproteobacteria bacterium]
MTSRARVILAVALPIAAILLGIVSAERRAERAPHLVFEIEGYDPRDLLRGHYLQFRLRVPLPAPGECEGGDPDCCLCVSAGEVGETARVERVSCASEPACDALLAADRAAMPLRFYVPEDRASELERRLGEAAGHGGARADVAIGPDGGIQVRGLWLDGIDAGSVAPVVPGR